MTKTTKTIIGAIIGDIIGSVYEWDNMKTTDIELITSDSTFTDDTVLTIAVADAILSGKGFADAIHKYGNDYPGRGYGGNFHQWLLSDDKQPYNSYGNGSAMRVSAVGFAYNDMDTVLEMAKKSAEVTHNHPEGIKGAQATAAAILLARQGKSKLEIKDFISRTFHYDLDFTIDEIRPEYEFDVSCQGSVPQAIVVFLESSDYESAIRLAISLGGDSDTIACIAGGVAAAFYQEIPDELYYFAIDKLPEEFLDVIERFEEEVGLNILLE